MADATLAQNRIYESFNDNVLRPEMDKVALEESRRQVEMQFRQQVAQNDSNVITSLKKRQNILNRSALESQI